MEAAEIGDEARVVARTETFGSLTLELSEASQPLAELWTGAQVEFSRRVEVEKAIKGWLLNGACNLIAIAAFYAAEGDRSIKLNQLLNATLERRPVGRRLDGRDARGHFPSA